MGCTSDCACHGSSDSVRAIDVQDAMHMERNVRAKNRFGSNMCAMGGILGGSPSNASATEHQGMGTPRAHGEIHIVCVYQYKLLPEIAKLTEEDVIDPKSIMDFNVWYHMEEPPNQKINDAMVECIEKYGRFF